VAQAKKQQADKATSIVKAQTATLPEANSQFIFSGCSQQAFPTISGSAFIQKTNAYGYALSSGSTLLFGGCTDKDVIGSVGDLISY